MQLNYWRNDHLKMKKINLVWIELFFMSS